MRLPKPLQFSAPANKELFEKSFRDASTSERAMTTLAIYSNKGGVARPLRQSNLSYLAARTGIENPASRSRCRKVLQLTIFGLNQTEIGQKG